MEGRDARVMRTFYVFQPHVQYLESDNSFNLFEYRKPDIITFVVLFSQIRQEVQVIMTINRFQPMPSYLDMHPRRQTVNGFQPMLNPLNNPQPTGVS